MTKTNNDKVAQQNRKQVTDGITGSTESTLKKTHEESRSVNPDRAQKKDGKAILDHDKDDSINKKYSVKQEKRLEFIQSILATLPLYVNTKAKLYASTILSELIEIKHVQKKIELMLDDLSYYPENIRNDFVLTCKKEFLSLRNSSALKLLRIKPYLIARTN